MIDRRNTPFQSNQKSNSIKKLLYSPINFSSRSYLLPLNQKTMFFQGILSTPIVYIFFAFIYLLGLVPGTLKRMQGEKGDVAEISINDTLNFSTELASNNVSESTADFTSQAQTSSKSKDAKDTTPFLLWGSMLIRPNKTVTSIHRIHDIPSFATQFWTVIISRPPPAYSFSFAFL